MKDFIGNELEKGDQVYVLVSRKTASEFVLGEITEFTNKGAYVKLLSESRLSNKEIVLKYSTCLAKVFTKHEIYFNLKDSKMYKPKTYEELKDLVADLTISLKDIDVSEITKMPYLFTGTERKDFDGINTWDTSKVTDMHCMFFRCFDFNYPLNFDTRNVTQMYCMFEECEKFNQPINFDTSNVEDMSFMFAGCKNFNQPLNFNTSKVKDMSAMFNKCEKFNQPLNFDTSNVEEMQFMFGGCKSFNQPINFNTSKVENMSCMFFGCESFNQPINFDTSKLREFENFIPNLKCIEHDFALRLLEYFM